MIRNNFPRPLILILSLFAIGFLFRLYILRNFPQRFLYDQVVYKNIALETLKHFFYVDRYRSYGFPFFMSLFFRLGSTDNRNWMVFQCVLDTVAGIMIFLLGSSLFRSSKIGLLSSLLYMLNIYTAAYVGVILSETYTTFVLCLFFFILLHSFIHKTKRAWSLTSLLLLGYLPQVKPSFLFFSILYLCVYGYWLFRKNILSKNKLMSCIFIIFMYFLPFIPTIYGNYVFWKEINLTEVDNNFVKEFYISLFMENGISPMPPEVIQIHGEYHTGMTIQERRAITRKYINLSIQEIKNNPVKFIEWRLKKMWYVWDKPLIFIYDPLYLNGNFYTIDIALNGFILLASLFGILIQVLPFKNMDSGRDLFHYSWILFALYITFSHAFSLADGRYTIPLYPLVMLYAGYCFYWFFLKFKSFLKDENNHLAS